MIANLSCQATPVAAAGTFILATRGGASLVSVFCSSSSSGTVTVYDAATGSGTPIVPVFTAAAATSYNLPAACGTGLTVVLGGTFTGTLFWLPGGAAA
jgi:hypothetical protein